MRSAAHLLSVRSHAGSARLSRAGRGFDGLRSTHLGSADLGRAHLFFSFSINFNNYGYLRKHTVCRVQEKKHLGLVRCGGGRSEYRGFLEVICVLHVFGSIQLLCSASIFRPRKTCFFFFCVVRYRKKKLKYVSRDKYNSALCYVRRKQSRRFPQGAAYLNDVFRDAKTLKSRHCGAPQIFPGSCETKD